MAIMKSCCCFSNTRSGSTASGICSLVFCVVSLIWNGYEFALYRNVYDYMSGANDVPFIIDFLVAGLLFVASVILLYGVSKDRKGLLIPYMVAMSALILLQIISWVIIFISTGYWGFYYSFIISLAVWIGFTILNIFCLLCVVSQYQELRDGRGRLQDVNRVPTVAMQQGAVIMTTNMTVPSGQPNGAGFVPQQAPMGYVHGPAYHPNWAPAPVGYPAPCTNPGSWMQPPPYAASGNQGPQATKN